MNERFVEQAPSLDLSETQLNALLLAWERFDHMLFRDQDDLESRGPDLPPMPRPAEPRLGGAFLDSSAGSRTARPKGPTLASERLKEFLLERKTADGNEKAFGDVGIYVEFAIAILGDRDMSAYSQEDMDRVAQACKAVPKPTGLPRQAKTSLKARYDYAAEKHDGLVYVGENTLKNRYQTGMTRFLKWALTKRYMTESLKFSVKLDPDGLNTVPLERDSFRLDEIERLLQMPTFSGHLTEDRRESGSFLLQDYIYWAYILLLTTGMRHAELAQLEVDDFTEDGGYWFVNIRAFNPELGRVARRNAKKHKTSNAARCIPLDLLVLDLGFMNRVEELRANGIKRVFPDWQPYVDRRNVTHWSTPISRDWDERKKQLGITRQNVSPYSARHSFGDRLDKLKISDRLRNRLMGHASKGAPGVYGASGVTDPELAQLLQQLETPELATMRRILSPAFEQAKQSGRLLKPWLPR